MLLPRAAGLQIRHSHVGAGTSQQRRITAGSILLEVVSILGALFHILTSHPSPALPLCSKFGYYLRLNTTIGQAQCFYVTNSSDFYPAPNYPYPGDFCSPGSYFVPSAKKCQACPDGTAAPGEWYA